MESFTQICRNPRINIRMSKMKALIRKLTIESRGTRRTDLCAFCCLEFMKGQRAAEGWHRVAPKVVAGYR